MQSELLTHFTCAVYVLQTTSFIALDSSIGAPESTSVHRPSFSIVNTVLFPLLSVGAVLLLSLPIAATRQLNRMGTTTSAVLIFENMMLCTNRKNPSMQRYHISDI